MSNVVDTMNGVKRKISVSFAPIITAAVKTFKPVEIGSDGSLAEIVTSRVWSPIIYKNNRRSKKNFLSASFLGFDIDGGLTLKSAIELVTDWQVFAMIGTTKSHQKEKVTDAGIVAPPCDRFRVIFKMSSECTDMLQFEYNVKLYLPALSGDTSCKDGARLFFPCEKIAHVAQGESLDWQIPPPGYGKPSKRKVVAKERHRAEGTIPMWVLRKVEDGVPMGGNGKPGRHSACYAIGLELTELGYDYEEIVSFIMTGPLAEIGEKDVRRQVEYGSDRAKEKQALRGGEEGSP